MKALRSPVARIRANPWLAVGIAALALLIVAWLGWSIYVASDRGVNEGLGVLIAVPALAIALAIVSLPFIGGYLLVKRLSGSEEGGSMAVPEEPTEEEAAADEGERAAESEPDDGDDEDESEEGKEDSEHDAEEESEAKPEAAAS